MNVPTARTARLWSIAQWCALLATVVLVVGLVVRPDESLAVLWNVLIPLVPLSLLLAPTIWRNVCPLATLNMLGNRPTGLRRLANGTLPRARALGIVLLLVLVPARRFLFNSDGTALAATIAAVALVALALGAFYEAKAGFCNSICPVLPVERLYGQRPLLDVANARCATCTACTSKGCIDLAPQRAISPQLGDSSRYDAGARRWLLTIYGAFAAAFPGFIVGYFTAVDGPLNSAGLVYLNVLGGALASYLIVAAVVVALGLHARIAMVGLGAVAAGLYYWFAADAAVAGLGLPMAGVPVIRAVTLTVVCVWAARALLAEPRTPAIVSRGL